MRMPRAQSAAGIGFFPNAWTWPSTSGSVAVPTSTRAFVTRNSPGLNLDGSQWLAKAGAALIGGDNSALEQMPSTDDENWQVVHTYLLGEAGIPIMEIVNCEELSQRGVYEFAFVAANLKIRGATAAPLRPLAMPFI